MAHVLTDEAFALAIAHFRRLGRADERGYWIAAIGSTFIPWNLATLAGVRLGGQIPDPARLGLDVIFPAAMVGLAVGLITGRRELVAAIVGAAIAVVVALADESGGRDRRRRPPRTGVGLLVPAAVGPRDGAARQPGVGRALRDARAPHCDASVAARAGRPEPTPTRAGTRMSTTSSSWRC